MSKGREVYELMVDVDDGIEPGVDKDGFYPGEREWIERCRADVARRERQAARDFKRSLKALLDEAERG